MRDQLKQEVERRRRNKFMNEIHEMRDTLKNKVDLENPKIWNKKPLDAKQALQVSELYRRKIQELTDPKY